MTQASLRPLLDQLKVARERKGLSQRALGDRVGLPQSHISKIESGGVDLQSSSLIELARAVDLEVVLIPRSNLPAVKALQDTFDHGVADHQTNPRPAYRLDGDGDSDE